MKWHHFIRSGLVGAMLFGMISSPWRTEAQHDSVSVPASHPRQVVQPVHKVMVDASDPAAMQAVQAAGGRLLADYGAFALWQVADMPGLNAIGQQGLQGLQVRDDDEQILLRNTTIHTALGQPAKSSVPDYLRQARTDEPQMWMVQFIGPVKEEWLAALQKLGLSLVSYVPNNAYVVWGDGQSLKALDDLALQQTFVQWSGAYHPAYRLAPALQAQTYRKDARVDVTVQFYRTGTTDRSLNALLAMGIGGVMRKAREDVLGFTNITLQLPAALLGTVANWPDVYNIEPWSAPQMTDEVQGQIMAGNVVSTVNGMIPTGPGYLAWLATKGFATTQANYPVVDVVDDGIDQGDAANVLHPDFHQFGVLANPARVTYISTCTSDPTGNGKDGHGNLNAGIVAGYNNLSGFPYTDTLGYRIGLGISPYGRVAGTKIFNNAGNYDISLCSNNQGLVLSSFNHGADMTSNSWSAAVNGAYDASAQIYDVLTRDASGTAPGDQQMLHIFAAANKGPGVSTIGSPGTAKNVLTVGATEGVRENGYIDGCHEASAGNADNMAAFSSRGPTQDGRIKPDISAPGTHIQGPASQDPTYTGSEVCDKYHPSTGQTLYALSSGTSHSTPGVAGAVSLLWEYYKRMLNPGQRPSPAMLKALMLNSPRYLTGLSAGDTLPSNNQGWGDVNLGMLFDGVPRTLLDQTTVFSKTGQEYRVAGTILDPTKPFRVSLVWSDAPGATIGNAYVNDLNLEVTVNGIVYRGNCFSGAYSVPCIEADPRNNVENVFLPAGTVGSYQVRVVAANIAGAGVPSTGSLVSQDFALVVYNATAKGGVIAGKVTNIDTSQPISGALVSATSRSRKIFALMTNSSGAYSLQIPPGTYTVTANAYGFHPGTPTLLTVITDTTTTQNIALKWTGIYVISGTVKENATGLPLRATVTISGEQVNPPVLQANTNPATGFYSFTVSGDQSYWLTASAVFHAYVTRRVSVSSSNLTANFALLTTTTNGGIFGYVRDFDTGTPVVSATVTAWSVGSPMATTDENGYYQILGIAPGAYDIDANANFYSTTTYSNVQINPSMLTSQNFMLQHGRLRYWPGGVQRTMMLGTESSDVSGLVISNTGAGTLNVTLAENLADGTPGDLLWLTESPPSAALAQSESTAVQLNWSTLPTSGIQQPGVYYGRLKIENDDPQSQGASVPLTLTVTPTPSQILLRGVVYSSGMCGSQYAPAKQAAVAIRNGSGLSATVGTDADGYYNYYVSSAGLYSFTFDAPSHFTSTAVVSASNGTTVFQNAVLRLDRSCIQVQPASFSTVVSPGMSTTLYLTVTSAGPQPLNVAMHEQPPADAEIGGPDLAGYMFVSTTLYNFIEISGTGTRMDPTDDNAFTLLTNFPLKFYGTTSQIMRVGNDGWILFGASLGLMDYYNTSLAADTMKEYVIAPFWDDLSSERGAVWFQQMGSAPNRYLVIEWVDRPHFWNTGASTFEVVFFENGNLLFQYKDVNFGNAAYDHGRSATVGIRGTGGGNSLQYSFNQAKINDYSAICFQSFDGPNCSDVAWTIQQPHAYVNIPGSPVATSRVVSVTLDTSKLAKPGFYTTTLWLVNNSPVSLIGVPISLMDMNVRSKVSLPIIQK